jgi:hypothetical protein
MKVNAVQSQEKPTISNKERERQEIRKKIAGKFGDKFKTKNEINEIKSKKLAELKKDKIELSDSAKKKAHIDPEGFGDVKNNNPKSEDTQMKLKGLLRSGGFQFSDKERAALGKILK